jgi:hypothetical protein
MMENACRNIPEEHKVIGNFVSDDSYKTFLKADISYMQNRYVLEGWLFTNFIARKSLLQIV